MIDYVDKYSHCVTHVTEYCTILIDVSTENLLYFISFIFSEMVGARYVEENAKAILILSYVYV